MTQETKSPSPEPAKPSTAGTRLPPGPPVAHVHFHKNEAFDHIFYDVELSGVQELKGYDNVECHIVVYPYGRDITSNDIALSPYEEYVTDVLSQNRSAYNPMGKILDKLFGLFLGAAVVVLHLLLAKEWSQLFQIEPLIAIFGAYVVGKELWEDVDRLFINLTKKWPVRYIDEYYSYRLERNTTLTRYSSFAKRHRYGKATLLPQEIEFIPQSNSQTVRMRFDDDDLARVEENDAHILSVQINPEKLEAFEKEGYMLGVKLSFNRRAAGILQFCTEYFQSLSEGEAGCLSDEEEWMPNTVFYRRTVVAGRLKYFSEQGVLTDMQILEKH